MFRNVFVSPDSDVEIVFGIRLDKTVWSFKVSNFVFELHLPNGPRSTERSD